MKITEEQFCRAIEAYLRYRSFTEEQDALWRRYGGSLEEFPDAGLLGEFLRQLEERCDDLEQVWGGEFSLIKFFLYGYKPDAIWPDGTRREFVSPAEIWAYWEATKTGPFAPRIRTGMRHMSETISHATEAPKRRGGRPKLTDEQRQADLLRALEIFPRLPDEALVREPVVRALLGISSSTVWNRVNDGRLPQPVRFSRKAVGWRAGDIRKTLAEAA